MTDERVEIPAGTVARCDRCGRREVLTEPMSVNLAGHATDWTEVMSACPCGDGMLVARNKRGQR
jgi:hypothetical protein